MQCFWAILLLSFVSIIALSTATCNCNVHTHIYNDLKCTPIYDSTSEGCCPQKYDCSHIYKRAEGTCHLKGHFYKPGESPDTELYAGRCDHASCTCGEGGEFSCIRPSDTCGEFWVPEWIQPGCYLKYKLNQCCGERQMCPPFDGNIKCEVNGVSYDEGKRFTHPEDECTLCVCDKGFNGKFEAPFCQKRNCTTEIDYSKEIRDYCAPLYRSSDTCCPNTWVCPSEGSTYIPASKPPTNQDLYCKYGDKKMFIGEKVEQQHKLRGKISCECLVPPYLTCKTATSS